MKTLTKMVILFCWPICLVFSADNTEEKLQLEQERLQQKQTELNQQRNGEFEKVVPGKHIQSDRIPIGVESGKSKEDVIPVSAQSEEVEINESFESEEALNKRANYEAKKQELKMPFQNENSVEINTDAQKTLEKEALINAKLQEKAQILQNENSVEINTDAQKTLEKEALINAKLDAMITPRMEKHNELYPNREYNPPVEPTHNTNSLNPDFPSSSDRGVVEIYFCTDSWPSESSFNVVDSAGNELYVGGYDASWIGSWSCYSEFVDLADGDYTLSLYDSYGDGGLCGAVYDPGVGTFVEYFCAEGYASSADFTIGGAVATCDDEAACNTGAEGDCTYATGGFDCDGFCDGTAASIDLVDSWGDGWNGNSLSFGDDTLTIESGSSASFEYCLADGDHTATYNADGSFQSENSWSVSADGAVIASFGAESGTFTIGGAPPVAGCTDDSANNYDATATLDDGTCLYGDYNCPSPGQGGTCCTSWYCDGSTEYGNGPWGADCGDGSDEGEQCCDAGYTAYGDCVDLYDCNGDFAGGAVADCNGDCGGSAVVDDCGDCGGDGSSCSCTDYTLVVGGGSFDSEISWDLGANSGAAGTFTVCLADGDNTFNGYESLGDGWNGGSFTITDADGNVVATGAVEGSSGSFTFCLGADCAEPIAGCTDDSANNYDAAATLDDGTCVYGDYDCPSPGQGGTCCTSWYCDGSTDYGNAGWPSDCGDGSDEGAQCCDGTYSAYTDDVCVADCNGDILGGAVEDCNSVCGGDAVLDDCGVCEGDGSSCSCTEYSLFVGGGSFPGEISWNITDASGNIILEGFAMDTNIFPCLADGDYTFNGFDSWGDGWNGGFFEIADWQANVIVNGAVEGSSGSFTFCLGADCVDPVLGCMDPQAPQYNPDADTDDGSCAYPGMDCAYFGEAEGAYYLDCDSWFCVPSSWLGDGGCDSSYFACDAFSCDGGDCALDSCGDCLGGDAALDCNGVCDGGAVYDDCGVCEGDGSSCSCDDLTISMTDSYGDSWNGNVLTIGTWTGANNGSTGTDAQVETACIDLTIANSVTCDGGSWQGEVSWSIADADGNILLEGGAPYAGCLGACDTVVGGCMLEGSANYNPDATYDDGTCESFAGMDCAYFGGTGLLSCDLEWCVPQAWLGDGGCDDLYFACDAFSCDGGDCAYDDCGDCNGGNAAMDCNGDCDGTAVEDECGVCEGDGSSCDCTTYTLVIGGGSFDSEISWQLEDGNGDIIYDYCPDVDDNGICDGGGAGTFDLCLYDDSYFMYGYDSWGDGWNGASWTLYSPDGEVAAGGENYTITEDNYYGWGWGWGFSLCASDGCGCTWEASENYNPDATIDDGSCILQPGDDCSYWGDEFIGYVAGCGGVHCYLESDIALDQGNGDCNAHAAGGCEDDPFCHGLACAYFACDGGDCGQDTDPEGECYVEPFSCEGITLTVGGGTFDSEITWSIEGTDYAGAVGEFCLELADGTYTFVMIDSWGDGWNGASANLYDADGTMFATGTLTTGTDGVFEFTVGVEVVAGCTDPTAPEYNEDATLDDGSCWFDCLAAYGVINWLDDNFCDTSNNNEACGFDGGDCCPGDCPEGGSNNPPSGDGFLYDCETNGGDCTTCLDPNSADLADDGQCNSFCGDGECTDDEDCSSCADDCGNCPWDATITGLDVFGTDLDVYGDGTLYPAVSATWDALFDGTSCEENGLETCWDGSCAEVGSCSDAPTGDCGTCEWDASNYGAECCDAALLDFGLTCGQLEANYGWDCSGCLCPGDADSVCGDGVCDGWAEDSDNCSDDCINIPAEWTCADSFYTDSWCDCGCGAYDPTCDDPDATLWQNCETGQECAAGDSECSGTALTCEEQGLWDCGDGQCINASWVCDGSTEFCNASWPADCTNGADEGLDVCDYEDECEGRSSDIAIANVKMKTNPVPVNFEPMVSANALTGEIVYSDGYASGNRAVSYLVTFSCETCGTDDYGMPDGSSWSFTWESTVPEFTVWGFEAGDNACVTVAGVSTELGYTEESAAECADAGAAECDDADADDICDDVDDCVGAYDDCGECNGDGSSCLGDANSDGSVNILDITLIVGAILNQTEIANADMNSDGAVNILDITIIVGVILNGDGRSADATSATMEIANGTVSISGDGLIGAVQMTLSHDAGFSIDLTNDAMVADYRTNGNTTTLIVVAPNSDEIFTANGDFIIEETLVANESGYVPLSIPTSFTLSAAYPNPFNPSTSLDLNMPAEGFVSIQAYNLVGQVVGTIAQGNMSAGTHSFTWDASDLSSGVYLVRAEYAGSIETQKVMLLK